MKDWETRTFARQPLEHAALDKLNAVKLPTESLYEGIVFAEGVRKQRFFDSVDVRTHGEFTSLHPPCNTPLLGRHTHARLRQALVVSAVPYVWKLQTDHVAMPKVHLT